MTNDPDARPPLDLDSLLVAGDFNCVTNARLDLSRLRHTTSPYDNSGAADLQNLISLLELHDVFRTNHPEEKRFTWGLDSVHRPKVRLDRWYAPLHHTHQTETHIDGSWQSDHLGVALTLSPPGEPPARGNQVRKRRVILTVLDDPATDRLLTDAIDTSFPLDPITSATASPHLPTNCEDPPLVLREWAAFKTLITSILIQASNDLRNKHPQAQTRRAEIIDELTELTEFLSGHEDPDEQGQGLVDELHDLRASLAQADAEALKSSAHQRALGRLHRQTQGTSQFFRSLVHLNNESISIKALFQESDWDKSPTPEDYHLLHTVESPKEILQTAASYYEWLFSHKPVCPDMLEMAKYHLAKRTLPEPARAITDVQMTPSEVHGVMTSLRNKGPGPDSIPNAFWKKHKDKLAYPLAKMFQAAIAHKAFHPSTTQGAITILHKKKDRRNIRNYRPIALLNTDYKIFTIILNERLKQVIHHIASQENSGFIPQRFIVENAHLLNMLRARSEELAAHAVPPMARFGSAFVSLDQEKAFDRASWEYLDMALHTLNFGQRFIASTKLMYNPANPPTRQLRINGFVSDFFPIRSGVPQGCAASPLLYIIFTECLTRMVNDDPSWSGIPFTIPGSPRRLLHRGHTTVPPENPRRSHSTRLEIKITQYADDTVLAISNPRWGMPNAMRTVDNYLRATAGRLNLIKCEGFLCGDARDSPPQAGFKWAEDGEYIIILGLPQGNDFDPEDFWLEIIDNIAQSLSRWRLIRSLVPSDRLAGFQGLIRSKLIYPLQFLSIPPKVLKTVNNLMDRLIWESQPTFRSSASASDSPTTKNPLPHLGHFTGRRWIAHTHASNAPIEGGIKVPILDRTARALQTRWLFRYLDASEGDWKTPLDHWILPTNDSTLRRGIILTRNPPRLTLRKVPRDLPYLRQALRLPANTRLVPQEFKSREEALAEPIFRSLRFTIRNCKRYQRLMEHQLDCWTLADLWDHSGETWWTASDMVDFASSLGLRNPPDLSDMIDILQDIFRAIPSQAIRLIEHGSHKIFPLPPHSRNAPIIVDISPHLFAPPELVEVTTDHNGSPLKAHRLLLTVVGTTLHTGQLHLRNPINMTKIRESRSVHSIQLKGLTYIFGAAERSYPHHQSWSLQPSSRRPDPRPTTSNPHSLISNPHLVSKMISKRRNPNPPASVSKWSSILHHKLTTRQVFRSTLLPSVLTKKDRNTRLKLLHRALILNRRRPSQELGSRCRLCRAHDETHIHLVACHKIKPIWNWTFEVISELEGHKITPTVTKCTLGIIPGRKKPLTHGSITMLDLTWKIIYWHLWEHTIEGTPFHHQRAIASIIERLHNAIQGLEARYKSLHKRGQRLPPIQKSRPMIKEYNETTRSFVLHPTISNAFEEHGWSQTPSL